MFSSSMFMVLGLTFRFLIHYELIPVYGVSNLLDNENMILSTTEHIK